MTVGCSIGNVNCMESDGTATAVEMRLGRAAFTPLQRADGIERRIRFGRAWFAGGEAG